MRLAIFCRRFWPYCDAEETEVADLAQLLIDAGHQVQVLTIQWSKDWPLRFDYREIPIVRLPRRWSGPWGMFRFAKVFERHIQMLDCEGLIVFGLSHESWVVLRSMCRRMPVVSRVNLRQVQGFNKSVFSRRLQRIPSQVREIFVDSLVAKELLQDVQGHGRAPSIEVVPPVIVVRQGPALSKQLRTTIRSQLTEAHPILAIEGRGPLVAINSHFDEPILSDMIQNWRSVLDHFPETKLWILGDGSKGKKIWEEICDAELADSIIMPGYFDHIDDVILAADLCVSLVGDGKGFESPFALKSMIYQIPLMMHCYACLQKPVRSTVVGTPTDQSVSIADGSNEFSAGPTIYSSLGAGRELVESIITYLENALQERSVTDQQLAVGNKSIGVSSNSLPLDIKDQLIPFINAFSSPI